MNKVWKLFVDENIKTWKKASTKIILILIILSLFGTLALTKLMEKYYKDNIVMYSANAETERWKENVKEEIKRIESSIENENLDDDTIYDLTVQKEKYEISLKYNINIYNAGWKREVIEEIATEKVNDNNSDKISRLEQMLEKQDYKEYINYQKEQLVDELKNNLITQQDYDDKLMILELKGKYNIDTIYDFYSKDGWKNMIISYIENAQNSLKTGLDQSNQKLLTVESKQKLEDDIKIGIYRLENNIPDPNYEDSNYRARFEALATSFVMAVIAVASIIIAGGEIATEISSGTIKFWALTPNKRWKIVTAKLLSVLFYMIIITLIMSVLTIIVANVAFTQEGSVYLYVKDGVVHEISNPIYMIETYFVKLIPVIIEKSKINPDKKVNEITKDSTKSISISKYHAVVFDMDGVIFDSEAAVMNCWLKLADKYGIKNIMKPYMACIGTTVARTREIMLSEYGNSFPYDEYAKETSIMYHEKYDGGRLPMKKGVVELLEFLKNEGKKIALASSTRRQTVMN